VLEIWLAFSAGLAGSGHCLGMCGGMVTALSLSSAGRSATERFLCNLLYHVGRITTYAILGLIAGLVAQAGMVELLRPYLQWLFLLANIFVAAVGAFTAIGMQTLGISSLDGSGGAFMKRQFLRLSRSSFLPSALLSGLLMGLLPCGLVYGVLIAAATSASALKGGGMMLAFGFGTVPLLLAYGQASSSLTALGRGSFQRCMGAIVALLGSVGVWKALVTLGYLS